MAEIFQDGDEGSQSILVSALKDLQKTAQGVLDDIQQTRIDTFSRIPARLGRPERLPPRAYRVDSADVAGPVPGVRHARYRPGPHQRHDPLRFPGGDAAGAQPSGRGR